MPLNVCSYAMVIWRHGVKYHMGHMLLGENISKLILFLNCDYVATFAMPLHMCVSVLLL